MFISNNIGIIADDLTGADDTALQFHLRGANTQILLDDSIIPENKVSTQVWAIPTETRNTDPHSAYERVKQAAKTLADTYNVEYFYKKMDSTLRGHIAVEALGVLEALEWDAAVIIPAFPQEGRITIGGYHLLKGIPLERTEFARDPRFPIYESHIPTVLRNELHNEQDELVDLIEFRTVVKGAGPILKKMNELIDNGVKLIVVDAISVTDIELAHDNSFAKVYFSVFAGDEETKQHTIDALENNVSKIRYEVGKRIRLRLTPELRFIPDDSLERGTRVTSLIDQLSKDEPKETE